MKMINKKYTWFNDPGHGWLRVPKKDIIALDIALNITIFSYVSKRYVYLEEDVDAEVFLIAAKKANWDITFREIYSNGPSKIRNNKIFSCNEL